MIIKNRFTDETIIEIETLTGANLSGADLSGADLSGADLSGANLSGANLSGADLTGANLTGANLSMTDLSRTNLSGANLSEAYIFRAYLSGANLSGANLSGADISHVSAVWGGYFGRHFVFAWWKGEECIVKIGCIENSLQKWLEDYERIGFTNGYFPKNIENYGNVLRFIKDNFKKGEN